MRGFCPDRVDEDPNVHQIDSLYNDTCVKWRQGMNIKKWFNLIEMILENHMSSRHFLKLLKFVTLVIIC